MRAYFWVAAAALWLGGCLQVLGNGFEVVGGGGAGGGGAQTGAGGGGTSGVGGGGGGGVGGSGGGSDITAVASLTIGGSGDEYLFAMAVAPDGSLVLAGSFDGTISVAGATLNSGGNVSGFVVKVDSAGVPVWARKLGDGAGVQVATAVAFGPNGDVVVGGIFSTSYPLTPNVAPSLGGNDIFVARFGPNGVLAWDRAFGGADDDFLSAVAVHADGRVMLAGDFVNTTALGGATLNAAGMRDMFLATLTSDGSHQQSQAFGGPKTDFMFDANLSDSGASYLAGTFTDAFTAGNTPLTSTGGADMVLVRVAPNGTPSGAVGAGSTQNDEVTALAVGTQGTVALAGDYRGDFSFGGGSTIVNGGGSDMLFALAQSDLSSVDGYGFSAAADQRATDIAIAPGAIIIAGRLDGPVDSGGLKLPLVGSSGYFVAGFNKNNQPLFGRTFAKAVSDQLFSTTPKIGVDNKGAIYLAGTFGDAFAVDGEAFASAGGNDVFVLKFQ